MVLPAVTLAATRAALPVEKPAEKTEAVPMEKPAEATRIRNKTDTRHLPVYAGRCFYLELNSDGKQKAVLVLYLNGMEKYNKQEEQVNVMHNSAGR